MQMNAIMAVTAAWLLGSAVPMMATMNWQMTMPRAPQMRSGRRPNFSIVQKEIGVEQTLTRVVMREMRKGLEMVPRDSKKVVPK